MWRQLRGRMINDQRVQNFGQLPVHHKPPTGHMSAAMEKQQCAPEDFIRMPYLFKNEYNDIYSFLHHFLQPNHLGSLSHPMICNQTAETSHGTQRCDVETERPVIAPTPA